MRLRKKAYVGIDPGVRAGVALISKSNDVIECNAAVPLRIKGKSVFDASWLYNLLDEWMSKYDIRAYVESQRPMPKQGVVSVFTHGGTVGAIHAVLRILGVPFVEIHPATWKKGMRLGKDKSASRDMATDLFGIPFERVKDHDLAEACLIAYYGKVRGL